VTAVSVIAALRDAIETLYTTLSEAGGDVLRDAFDAHTTLFGPISTILW
jgi:hypothetical protein